MCFGCRTAPVIRTRGSGLSQAYRGGWQQCHAHCHGKLWAPRPRLENRFRHVVPVLMTGSGRHNGGLRQASTGHRSIKTTTGSRFSQHNSRSFGQISHSEIAMLLKPAGASISCLMSLGIKKSWCESSAQKLILYTNKSND